MALTDIFGTTYESIAVIAYASESAAFTVGETVTQATTTASGVLIYDSGSKLYITADSGTFDMVNTLTGGSSGSTATPKYAADAATSGTVKKVTYGSLTGAFVAGETVTQATSAATGTVLVDDGTHLWLLVTSGTFDNSHGLTGGTSGATATASAVASVTQAAIPYCAKTTSFALGETITQSGSNATGVFFSDSGTGITVGVATGTFNKLGALTGGTSKSVASPRPVPVHTIDVLRLLIAYVRGWSTFTQAGLNAFCESDPKEW
jgi:hypothetical protein